MEQINFYNNYISDCYIESNYYISNFRLFNGEIRFLIVRAPEIYNSSFNLNEVKLDCIQSGEQLIEIITNTPKEQISVFGDASNLINFSTYG